MPTRLGDVLILQTDRDLKIHAVGQVAEDGQQDFHAQRNVKYISDRAAALAEAKALLLPGRRIFLSRLDAGHWSEISA
jgi:hypothetical protein